MLTLLLYLIFGVFLKIILPSQSVHEGQLCPVSIFSWTKMLPKIACQHSILYVTILCYHSLCLYSISWSSIRRALPSYQKTQFCKWQVMSLTLSPGWFDVGHQGDLLSCRREACTEDTRRSKNFGSPAGIRREERATGKDIIALETSLHWFLCRKPVIPILFKSVGQQSHVLSSQFITPTLSRTLLQLREGVLLIQTLLQLFLKRGKRFHKYSSHWLLLPFFPRLLSFSAHVENQKVI